MFERFYRVPGNERPGSGLGLAIVRQAATRPRWGGGRHGRLAGSGIGFGMRLPLEPAPRKQALGEAPQQAPGAFDLHLHRPARLHRPDPDRSAARTSSPGSRHMSCEIRPRVAPRRALLLTGSPAPPRRPAGYHTSVSGDSPVATTGPKGRKVSKPLSRTTAGLGVAVGCPPAYVVGSRWGRTRGAIASPSPTCLQRRPMHDAQFALEDHLAVAAGCRMVPPGRGRSSASSPGRAARPARAGPAWPPGLEVFHSAMTLLGCTGVSTCTSATRGVRRSPRSGASNMSPCQMRRARLPACRSARWRVGKRWGGGAGAGARARARRPRGVPGWRHPVLLGMKVESRRARR